VIHIKSRMVPKRTMSELPEPRLVSTAPRLPTMKKLPLKLLLASSIFNRRSKRIDWDETIAILGSLITIGLIGLYLWAHQTNYL
jgi:hypothetical protein